ncbi:MAG: threonine--tRNA ligase [Butyrivibrio sp.]|uniref:Threonine--tRNA ligase n=1 Tax=Butyrivibrio hungatei TaxID=185008 RepID=A0A1G5DW53_9FIRM|nr:threonine--tRNA ligase [Butyrivibrio hungatei]MBQ4218114.1 threonine--tRNA ligase [Butyrivibrio sp.]MBR4358033.1 threonine--tRNA ligase [Butyrivibrio sp.]MEE3471769.1 threonine--tRNA ligase [Butyrivibrio hungatei]SCY18979.1 threonyl-tRNA synthetase [Butyrivibrio hungatei]
MTKEEYLEVYRHSLAHILAKAVIELYGKEVQYAIGPQIDDGCYYDFVLPKAVTQDDFKTIEDKMREIIKRREDFTRKEVSRAEALEMFKDQKFKTELINDLPEDETLTVYYTGDDYVDLCRGPHVANSQELMNVAYQVKAVSGAYWRGDEKRDQLSRIYLYAFPSKDELKKHIKMIQEAMERDHKKIGAQLDLFMFDETAPGMPYWLPRGWKMYQALLKYSREVQERHGYTEIAAPLVNNKKLWLISGHWAHYVNNMFMVPGVSGWLKADAEIPGILENINEPDEEPKNIKILAKSVIYNREQDDTMAAKPMNCPNAMMTYKRTNHSYKELPIRYSEYDVLHRKEKSGQMNGLFRVQEFRQDDDHTFVMESQIKEEIADIIAIADEIYSTFGVTYRAEFSTRPDDFMGDIEVWNRAEAALKEILDEKYGEGGYEINEGDGAFYGPKIDLQIKDALGREWQCGTVQLDFQLPHNFGLTYQAQDGTMQMPVVIHRAIYGSLERFIGIIIENFKGVFPFWLSPYQVGIVPIRVEHNEYAKKVEEALVKAGIRVEADYSDNNMKEKIKKFKNYKDPYIIVVGDKEAQENTVSINVRGSNKQVQNVPLDALVEMCKKMNEEHSLELIDSYEA